MKKVYLPIAMGILLMSSSLIAQQKAAPSKSDGQTHSMEKTIQRKTFSTKPAVIKGMIQHVVFGTEPAIEMKRAIENNVPITFEGRKYYYNQGNFFRYNGGRYLLIAPPVGLKVKTLPKQAEEAKKDIYYHKGIFFKANNGEFEVIKHPEGAIIFNLPPQVDVVTVNDVAYYEYLGVLYQKAFVNGEQAFEVVGELTE